MFSASQLEHLPQNQYVVSHVTGKVVNHNIMERGSGNLISTYRPFPASPQKDSEDSLLHHRVTKQSEIFSIILQD